jgi:hypothetical protein
MSRLQPLSIKAREAGGMVDVADPQGAFVSQLQTKVLALYTLMQEQDAHFEGGNRFKDEIRYCLLLFFNDTGRQLVRRTDNEWEQRERLGVVPKILAKAAKTTDGKGRYSPAVGAAFDDLKRYVTDTLLGESDVVWNEATQEWKKPAWNEATQEWNKFKSAMREDPALAVEDERMQALLAAMKTLIQDYARQRAI